MITQLRPLRELKRWKKDGSSQEEGRVISENTVGHGLINCIRTGKTAGVLRSGIRLIYSGGANTEGRAEQPTQWGDTEFGRYRNRPHESGSKKLALGLPWEILGVTSWVGRHSDAHKSNKASTQESQEAGSHLWGCLFAGSKIKRQDADPEGTGGRGRTLKQGMNVLSL